MESLFSHFTMNEFVKGGSRKRYTARRLIFYSINYTVVSWDGASVFDLVRIKFVQNHLSGVSVCKQFVYPNVLD